MADVVTWNESEASLEKEAKVYNDFTYDTETDSGILNKLDEVSKIMDSIQEDVNDISTKYTELQALYNTFTNFNDNMDDNKSKLQMSIDTIRMSYNSLVENMDTQIEELQKNDEELMTDLENINDLLTTTENNDDSSKSSKENTSNDNSESNNQTEEQSKDQSKDEQNNSDQQQKEQAKEEQQKEQSKEEQQKEQAKSDDNASKKENPTANGEDLDKVVNDVINGKYGAGDNRKEALEKAGYDSSQVQQLVNEKLTGKKSSNTQSNSSSNSSSASTSTAATGTQDTSTQAGFMPSSGSGLGAALVSAASEYMGTKYVLGGESHNGIDCSGLVMKAGQAIGLNLPHYTGSLANVGTRVDKSEAQVGDLIFTNSGKHVVICTGRDANGNLTAISASSKAGEVKNVTVNKGIVQVRRIV